MAQIGTQIHAVVDDAVGKLAELAEKLAAANVNILGTVAWTAHDMGHILLATDDNAKACEVIQPVVKECSTAEAVCVNVSNQVGELAKVARKLADAGISISVAYATVCGCDQTMVVLETSDNAKAAEII